MPAPSTTALSGGCRLQNLFSKRRKCKFHSQVGCLVVFVNYRIDLNDLEAKHAAVVGNNLHGEVGFTVGGTAADWRADSRRVFGINPIHIERDVISGRAASRNA